MDLHEFQVNDLANLFSYIQRIQITMGANQVGDMLNPVLVKARFSESITKMWTESFLPLMNNAEPTINVKAFKKEVDNFIKLHHWDT